MIDMQTKQIVLLVILCISLLLIGAGITGRVVSQSCCFPPNCSAADLCKTGTANNGLSIGDLSFYVGSLMLVLTAGIYLIAARKHGKD